MSPGRAPLSNTILHLSLFASPFFICSSVGKNKVNSVPDAVT